MWRQQGACLRILAVAALLVPLCAVDPARAEDEEPLRIAADPEGIFTLAIENDSVARSDGHYTSGVRAAWLSPETDVPRWLERAAEALPLFAEEGRKRYGFAVGQSMFTPEDISVREPLPDDRPYAGWLYGSIGLVSDTGQRLDNLELAIGVVGPASLAEESQEFIHSLTGSVEPKGWDNQLENEPGIILTYERKWRGMWQAEPFGFGADFTPHAGGSIGNVFTHVAVGATVRLGQDLPADYGPPRIRPSLPGSDFFVPTRRFGWYLFAGVEGRAVARNIFLDGNTWRDSQSVDKQPLIGDLQIGLAVTVSAMRIAYTHVFRTKEFEGQDEADEFGALTLSFRF